MVVAPLMIPATSPTVMPLARVCNSFIVDQIGCKEQIYVIQALSRLKMRSGHTGRMEDVSEIPPNLVSAG